MHSEVRPHEHFKINCLTRSDPDEHHTEHMLF